MKMVMRDQLRSLNVSLLGHRCKHDAQSAVRGFVGAVAGQRQRCIDGFVYSAGASEDVMKELDTVIE